MYKKSTRKKDVSHAKAHIYASFNNTLITISDLSGNVVCWSSAGMQGFKGSRKSTPYAAQLTGDDILKKASNFGVKSLDIHVKGVGSGRENALRALANSGLKIIYIKDETKIPHNGCRPPKKRRI
jgi:small subunit ribosomal protein S11